MQECEAGAASAVPCEVKQYALEKLERLFGVAYDVAADVVSEPEFRGILDLRALGYHNLNDHTKEKRLCLVQRRSRCLGMYRYKGKQGRIHLPVVIEGMVGFCEAYTKPREDLGAFEARRRRSRKKKRPKTDGGLAINATGVYVRHLLAFNRIGPSGLASASVQGGWSRGRPGRTVVSCWICWLADNSDRMPSIFCSSWPTRLLPSVRLLPQR